MRSIIVLASIFATIDNNVVPLQFLQSFIFPFFSSLMMMLWVQLLGICLYLQTLLRSWYTFFVVNSISAFNKSAVIESTPGDFPFCNLDIAALTSLSVGSLVAISSITPSTIHRSSSVVGFAGCPRLSISLKYSVYLACTSSLLLKSFPFLSNTAVLCLGLSLQIFFVSLYNVLIR